MMTRPWNDTAPDTWPSQEKTIRSLLTSPVFASTFSMPKIFWRAAIIAGSAAANTGVAAEIAPAAASAARIALCFMYFSFGRGCIQAHHVACSGVCGRRTHLPGRQQLDVAVAFYSRAKSHARHALCMHNTK